MQVKAILMSPWTRWLVSLVLLGILLYISDLALIGKTVATANVPWLVAGFFVAMLLTAYGGVKWWVLMPRNRAAAWVFVRVNYISNFVGIFFPGIIGIEAARIAGITQSSQDLPAAFSSVLVDRVFGLMTLAITVVIGGVVATTVVPPTVTVACMLALLALLCGVAVIMSYRCRALLGRILPRRINSALTKFYECMDLYRDRKPTLVLSLVLSLIFQMLRVVMVYCLARSLSMDIGVYLSDCRRARGLVCADVAYFDLWHWCAGVCHGGHAGNRRCTHRISHCTEYPYAGHSNCRIVSWRGTVCPGP